MIQAEILIEVIGSHNCTGYKTNLPSVIKTFIEETKTNVEFKVYAAIDVISKENVPIYIWNKICEARKGSSSNNGLFINGDWYYLRPHSADDEVTIKKRLTTIIKITDTSKAVNLRGEQTEKCSFESCKINEIAIRDSEITKLSIFCTKLNEISIFEGEIDKLSLNCSVKELNFDGYNINQLVEFAKKNPSLFSEHQNIIKIEDNHRKKIADVKIELLGMEDLKSGKHPCFINGCNIDPSSKLHNMIMSRIGGWGYEAKIENKTCGFLGIIPKDIALQDLIGTPLRIDCGIEPDKILYLYCIAGGAVYGYPNQGIGTMLAERAIKDAKKFGFKRIEATPFDWGVQKMYLKMGFLEINLDSETLKDKKNACYLNF